MNRREALRELGSGATLGALFGAALVIVRCQPVEAPAAEPDPLLALIEQYRVARDASLAMPYTNDAECDAFEMFDRECVEPLFWRLVNETPEATTAAGAAAALRLVHEGIDKDEGECAYDEALFRAVFRYLEGKAA